jgi:hypothetical protein
MSLLQYTIVNQSAISKIFQYYSASSAANIHRINVSGFGTIVFEADDAFPPTQVPTGVPEADFLSDAYVPPSGSAWLWNNGEKVQYIKISNTPKTGSNIGSTINQAEWIEFSMVGAVDKNGSLLYPTAPNSSIVERYIIGNANNKGTYNSIITNDSSPETSIAVAANTSSDGTGFSYIDSQFSVGQDCNPLLNNATEPRINEWLQDVDYSVNAITPVNFDQLINFTATKAAVPQSNYTQLGFVHSRYVGSSTTRDKINEYNPLSLIDTENKLVYSDETSAVYINKGKGPSLGKVPNVELNNAYIAYFNKVIDPYPILNNKVAYYTKYLIDSGGNILDPSVSNINFSILQDTFQLKDYDNLPTRVNTAISNIDQGKELLKLNEGMSSVYRVGEYPVPILYTQISSVEYVNEISLSGSKFYSLLGPDQQILNLGINVDSTQSFTQASSPLSPQNLSINTLKFSSANITPFISNDDPVNIPTSSLNIGGGKFAILFPEDPSAPIPNEPGADLSTNYRVEGNFTFTTSAIPSKYRGANNIRTENYIKRYLDRRDISNSKLLTFRLYPYIKPIGENDITINYVLNTGGFNIKKVTLNIISNPGPNEVPYKTLEIEKKPEGNYSPQWGIDGNGFFLTPDSLYIEDLIITKIGQKNILDKAARKDVLPLVAGGWYTNYGYSGIPIRYDWNIEFEFNSSIIKQDIGLYLKAEGSIVSQNGQQGGVLGNGDPLDVFLFFGANGEPDNNWQWARTFTPTYSSGVSTQPILKYKVTSDIIDNVVTNTASGPFWRRYPIDGNSANALTTNELYMSSSILNQAYVSVSPYLQAKLPYIGGPSTAFPLTVEPSFMEFDAVTDIWELKEGDEIRFENNEDLTFTITSIDGKQAITIPNDIESEAISNKLRVVVTPPFEYIDKDGKTVVNQPTNFDFFIIRRYKENKNFIILDQQMPYGVISTGKGEVAFSSADGFVGVEPVNPSTSPGILLPEHRIEVFNKNPDLVLKDLIEKRII